MEHVLAFGMPGIEEWMVIAFIGVILFGKRLPEVGRNVGKGIVEFKKGLKGIEEEVETASAAASKTAVRPAAPATSSYAFDPVTGEPIKPQLASPVPTGAKFDPYTGKPLMAETVATSTTNA